MYFKTFLAFFMLLLLIIIGCEQKKAEVVIQGRVLEYDPQTMIVTIIKDKNADAIRPDYNTLPPEQFILPKDVIQKGFEPTDGYRMKLDADKNNITLYNPETKAFEHIDIVVIDKKTNIQRDDNLVYDIKKQEFRMFPIINKDQNTVTLYSVRQKIYITFKVDKKHIDLPAKAWRAGDDIKISYKDDKKVTKFTNITKSDLLHFKSQN
ncbi:MAG: DUF4881 domain-containing protein [Thermodesulfovibrionales bacterium]